MASEMVEDARFLLKNKQKKFKNLNEMYSVNISQNSFESNRRILKNIEILERDIVMLDRLLRIYKLYNKRVPIYPLKGEELLSMLKVLKELGVKHTTKKQIFSPVKIDNKMWGYNNTLVIIDLTGQKSLESSYDILSDQEEILSGSESKEIFLIN